MTETTALIVPERAAVALASADIEKQLCELTTASAAITEITNPAGYDQCHSTRMSLKRTRLNITASGKTAREDAQKFSTAVIAEERRLIGLISPEENRLEALQKEWDDRKEAERQARIAVEEARVAAIQSRIDAMRGSVAALALAPVDRLAARIAEIEAIVIDETFAEFQPIAVTVHAEALEGLRRLHDAAVERVAEAERIRVEREELARQRAEQQAERDRIADERREAQEAQDKATAKLAEERAELARREEVLRKASEPAPAVIEQKPVATMPATLPPAVKRPTDQELIAVIASHFGVTTDTAIDWLSQIDLSVAA